MSIAAADCRFRFSQLTDLPPYYSHGWSLSMNAQGQAWLDVSGKEYLFNVEKDFFLIIENQ
jgi:hypothetical protein